jgi:hypothetical protein
MSDATGTLVDQIKTSLRQENAAKLADALESLVTAEPIRWRQLLHLGNVWPDPSPQKTGGDTRKVSQYLGCMMKAIKILLDREGDHLRIVEEIMLTLQACIVLQGYYDDIVAELKKLAFGKSPPEVQIHRLLAFVESQSRKVQTKMDQVQEATGVFDLITGLTSVVPTKFDDSKFSYSQVFEALCENVELGLRFILHSHSFPAQPAFEPTHGPYRDPDIEMFLNLAGVWRMVTETYANMRFRDWRWRANQGEHRGCVPTDAQALLREHAGGLRYQLFLHDRIVPRLASELEVADYVKRLEETAKSITVPAAGEPWDGNVNIEALKALCSLSPLRIAVEEYVHHRHYLPLIDTVRVGSVGWREWVTGKEVLYGLADAISQAVTAQVADGDLACMRQVVVIKESVLCDILVNSSRLTAERATDLVRVLRFDPSRKSLEIWDQPLIPCGTGIVFLVPAIVKTGGPARALENFITQWGGASFDSRGTPSESYVVRETQARSSARAEKRIVIERPGATSLEFDVIIWWEGHLILSEAKCEKAVFSAPDYHCAKRQIEESIDQLVLRRQALPQVWSDLRAKVPSLGLPEQYVGDDRVLCIAITNIMDFTGYVRDGVVVTDDSCFLRFFGERMIKKGVIGEETFTDVEPIRASEEPNPSEFMQYLTNPPQMRRLIDKMCLKAHAIPAIGKHSSGFLSVHVELEP